MTKAEQVTMEVEAPIVKKEKKSKKSKKTVEEDEVTTLKRAAQAEHEDAPKKKKSKKNKTAEVEAEAEPVAMETEEKTEKKEKKKKSKKNKEAVEEEKVEEKAEEAAEEPEKEAETTEKAAESTETPASLTVFVGGLPWSAEEATVKKDFEECGTITSFRFLTDRETGQPKGSCFIDYADAEGLKKALEFNETDYGGRTIYVRVANDESHKGKGKKGGKKGKGKGELRQPGEKPDGCKSVIVKNFTYDTTEDALWKMFEGCGGIDRLKLLTDRETGESKGIAFIDFSEESAVDEAIKKCNTDVGGRSIFVDYSGNNDKGGKKGDKGGKKGDGKKGKGKKGKGKGKKGKESSFDGGIRSANQGSIVEATGAKMSFNSDSE